MDTIIPGYEIISNPPDDTCVVQLVGANFIMISYKAPTVCYRCGVVNHMQCGTATVNQHDVPMKHASEALSCAENLQCHAVRFCAT